MKGLPHDRWFGGDLFLRVQDTAQADAVLQNYYLPVVVEMINQRALLLFGYTPAELDAGMGHANAVNGETINYRGITKDADAFEFAGRKWFFAAHTKRNESGTATSEGGLIPLPGQQGYEDFSDGIVHFAKQFEITGYSMEISERNVGRFLSLLEGETEGTINDARHDLNRQGYGDKTGTLAIWTAEGANTITVDTVQYLRVGMFIDFINSATDAVQATNRKITAINSSTKVVTYDGADAAGVIGSGTSICIVGNWKKEINGLKNIIGPDGASYPILHTVDGSAAGNEYWQGKVYDGNAATFDEDQGQQILDDLSAEGWETELLITTRGIRRRYVNTLKAQKRFNDSMAGVLHGGFKTIDFNGVSMTIDDQAPKGNMWFLRPSDLLWFYLGANDFRWLQRDGKILRMTIGVGPNGEDKDNWRATLYRYHDLACKRRKTQARLKNLADDAAKISS